MAKKDDCITNPVTGERVEFLKTAEGTDGGLLEIMMTVQPNAIHRDALVHPVQDVHFAVKSGTLKLITGNDEHELIAGQEINIPCGTPYTWWNDGDDELKTVMEFQPALQMEDLFTSLFALSRAGKTNKKGLPNFLQASVMIRKYKYEVFMAKPSIRVQKLLALSIAWLARLLGFQADYPYRHDVIVLKSGSKDGDLALVPIENRCD